MDDHRVGEDSRPASVRAKLQQLASAGGEIAQALERGQAEAPIAELFEVLEAVRGSDSGLIAEEGRWLHPLRVQLPADCSHEPARDRGVP